MSHRQQAMTGGRTQEKAVSGWTVGFAVFAGAVMIMGGLFQMFQGLAAILNDEFFVVGEHYAFEVDITAWGWIHLIVGMIVALAGFWIFSGYLWARLVGITVAVLSAVANFFFIPYYPVWSVLIIALDIVVIFALASYSQEAARGTTESA